MLINKKRTELLCWAFPFFGHRQVAMTIEKLQTIHALSGTWTFVACSHVRSLAVSKNENKDTKSKYFIWKKVCARAAASWVSKNVVSFSLRGAGPGPCCSPYNVRERFAASVLLMFTVCFLLNIGFKGFYIHYSSHNSRAKIRINAGTAKQTAEKNIET